MNSAPRYERPTRIARKLGAAEDPPEIIPEWDSLSLAMRLAFIHVYGLGRQLGAKEERDLARRESK
jgi:hypothetical protein